MKEQEYLQTIEQLKAELARAHTTDQLTEAMNTPGLMQYGAKLVAQGKLELFTAVFFNLKGFKYINAVMGNRVGDQVLIEYVRKNLLQMRDEEVFVRLGGDNFFVLIYDEHLQEYLDFLEDVEVSIRLDESLSRTFNISAYVALYNIMEGDTMNSVMNAASVAQNIGKESGERVIWFKPDMMRKSVWEKEVSRTFEDALRNEEFMVYYQPKVSVKDGAICGGEALARWNHKGKMISPIDFIPTLEKEGTICKLDYYILEKVCCHIKDWEKCGIEIQPISVNFSRRHMENKNWTDNICRIIDKYEINTKYIEIELTESFARDNYPEARNAIQRLREKGMSVSIDDFGIGYSSLAFLRQMDVDIIKLDRSFLSGCEKPDEASQIILKNIIQMINELNMEVLAEGVEVQEQATYLKRIGCSKVQGFLFDRPIPKEDFEMRLKDDVHYNDRL